MLYGRNMLGSRMIYLPPDGKARTQQLLLHKVGMISMVQNELDASEPFGGTPFEETMYMTGVIASMGLELFARGCGGGFDESENEFFQQIRIHRGCRAMPQVHPGAHGKG